MALLTSLSTAQSIGLVSAALLYVVAGTLHFIKPDAYLKIMPPYIPWHVAMVSVSGGFGGYFRVPGLVYRPVERRSRTIPRSELRSGCASAKRMSRTRRGDMQSCSSRRESGPFVRRSTRT